MAGAYRELSKLQKEERHIRYTQAVEAVVKGIPEFGVPEALDEAVCAPPPRSQATATPHAIQQPLPHWPGHYTMPPVPPAPVRPEEVELWVVWTGTKASLTIHETEVEALRAALAVVAPSTVVPVRYGEPVMEAVSAMEAAQHRKKRAAEAVAAEARQAAFEELQQTHKQKEQ